MIESSGHIVRIEQGCLWVESAKTSGCVGCKSQPGCGQAIFSKWGAQRFVIPVLPLKTGTSSYEVGDEVRFGMPDGAVLRASLLVYLVPAVGLLLGAWLGASIAENQWLSLAGGLVGLIGSGFGVYLHTWRTRLDGRMQPSLIDERDSTSDNRADCL